jgi:hypothetical protein
MCLERDSKMLLKIALLWSWRNQDHIYRRVFGWGHLREEIWITKSSFHDNESPSFWMSCLLFHTYFLKSSLSQLKHEIVLSKQQPRRYRNENKIFLSLWLMILLLIRRSHKLLSHIHKQAIILLDIDVIFFFSHETKCNHSSAKNQALILFADIWAKSWGD